VPYRHSLGWPGCPYVSIQQRRREDEKRRSTCEAD
jgi:hypothetical protein